MTRQVFIPPQQQRKSSIPQARIKVPDPLDNPTKKKANPLLAILPAMGMLAMVGMMGLMAFQMKQTTGQINVMSMMYPLMMVPMMLPVLLQSMGGGIDHAELNENRVKFAIAQREARERIHDQGERVHGQQTTQFPAPDALVNYVGSKNTDHPVMWRVSSADPGGLQVDLASVDGEDDDRKHITYAAYLAPRIGVGTVRRIPFLDIDSEQPVPELLEPTSMTMWRRFILINSFMPAMPVALNLGSAPFYEFEGDPDAILSASRAMIASLAFNHPPSDLKLGIISPNIDKPHWDWMKWLPHVEDATRQDRHGNARRAYRTLDEFTAAHRMELIERGQFMSETENTDRWIVFIDAPDRDVLRPPNLAEYGADGISFVVLRAGSNNLVNDTRNRFRITADRDLVSASGVVQAKVDQLSVLDAKIFAKKLSQYTATAAGTMQSLLDMMGDDDATTPATNSEEIPDFFQVLGIDDIDEFDPSQRWERIKFGSHLKFPIGYVRSDVDTKAAIPTSKLEYLDLIEMSRGGTPHGVGQGITGSGKSFLLTTWIATMVALFGPDRLNLILADMKGGSAFNPFRGVPHVSEIVTNLGDDTEFVDRFGTVLRGEVQRRQEFLDKMNNAKDIYQYRDFMAAEPDKYPPLADLVVIIDEFGKFMEMMKLQPENRQALIDIGRLGRSLGIHLIPFSQSLDEHSVGADLWEHMQFFVSLQTATARQSQQMLQIPSAEFFQPGAAMIRDKTGRLVPFMAFDSEAEYVPRLESAPAEVDDDEIVIATDTTLRLFTLENHELVSTTDTLLTGIDALLDDVVEPTDSVEQKPAVPRDKQMLYVLIDKLRQYQHIKARKLWLPTLREPVTMHPEVMRIEPVSNIADASFTLGLIDDAYGHARPPMVVRTEGRNTHLCFKGDSRSGLTQALAAVIGSASVSHDPRLASFYIVDPFGAGLSYVSEFINVGSYASQTDTGLAERIIGEAQRLIDHRENAMALGRHTSFASYFEAKQHNPDPDDVYGRYYLTIDRIDLLLDRDPTLHPTIHRILDAGGACGVHLVATTTTTHYKWEQKFGFIHLYGSDGEPDGREVRQAVTSLIPEDYPGRTVQMYKPRNAYLSARILVPTMEPIRPTGVDRSTNRPVWPTDYSTLIREFGQLIRAYKSDAGVAPATPISVVPDEISFSDFWNGFRTTEEHRNDRRIGLGLNQGDLKWVLAPPGHLVVSGAGRSGRTNALRVYINSITQTYSPDEVKIFIADPSFQLKTEYDILAREGYALPDYGYAYDTTSVVPLAEAINTYAVNRRPDIATLDSKQIQDGTFWSGPRIFVLIDDYQRFNAAGSSFSFKTVFDEIASHLGSIDIGISFVVTIPDIELSKLVDSGGDGLGKAFATAQTPILGLSGSGNNVLRPRLGELDMVRFARRRPGQAQLYEPGNPEFLPILQMPLVRAWATV